MAAIFIDRHELRMTVLSACAWRLIAELMRRHSSRHSLHISQFHPGISVRGCIQISVDDARSPRNEKLVLELGGPEPGKANGLDFVSGMLSVDPIATVDQAEALLRLKAPARLPESTPQALACRVIAELLGRRLLDRTSYRTTAAWCSGGPAGAMVARWAARFDEIGSSRLDSIETSVAQGRLLDNDRESLSPYVAVHECTGADDLLLDDAENAWLFDVDRAKALVVRGKNVVSTVDLVAEYARMGRRLGGLVSLLDIG